MSRKIFPSGSSHRVLRAIVLSLGVVPLMVGCALRQAPPSSPAPDAFGIVDDFPRSRQVAMDFVDSMLAQPALMPGDTTLFTTRPNSRFGEILVSALQRSGYDLRLVAEPVRVTLDYGVRAVRRGRTTREHEYTFEVIADDVRLERQYAADLAGIRATSAMRIAAVEAAPVATEVGMAQALRTLPASAEASEPATFRATASDFRPSAVSTSPMQTRNPQAGSSSATSRAVITPAPDIQPSPSEPSASVRPETPTRPRTAPVADLPPLKHNMYDTRRSNYAGLLDTYETVREHIMVFPNDSLIMGRDNKRVAQVIAEDFDARRDLISLIGCSHGPTALANGNEVLANGRAYRVKEAFMLAGIEAELVLDEGCWAGTHFDAMPARGVVVMHKRKQAG